MPFQQIKKSLARSLASMSVAVATFLQPFILISLFGGAIGALLGQVPWWWGIMCAIICWILTWFFAWLGGAILQQSLTHEELRIVDLTMRIRRGDISFDEEMELSQLNAKQTGNHDQ